MERRKSITVACMIAGAFVGAGPLAAEVQGVAAGPVTPPTPATLPSERLRLKPHAALPEPAVETPTSAPSNAGFNTQSAFTASSAPSPNSQSLSAPVTITYSGGSPVLVVNDKGTDKGVESLITNSRNETSALFGQTNGSGAGLTGYNSGTVGPAGKFGIINAHSAQPAVSATTNGTGQALFGAITQARSDEPAILGQNLVTKSYGTGVEGDGNVYGVAGYSEFTGVFGSSANFGVNGYSPTGTGVYGQSSSGVGLSGSTDSGYGVKAYGATGIGLYASSDGSYAISAVSNSDIAIHANSYSGIGVYSESGYSNAIQGISQNHIGVVGQDTGNGYGIYGTSATGYAGYFDGTVAATSYASLSDRNAKTNIQPLDTKAILSTVSKLPLSSWVFKSDPAKNHMGPMAQDFHAAFGLDGDDDKHISMTDIAGVSLAAIQELNKEMKAKDAEIASLKQQLTDMGEMFSARMTALEQQAQLKMPQKTGIQRETDALGE